MYSVGAAALVVVLIWLGILSYFLWRERQATKRLFPQEEAGDIRDKFREVLATVDGLKVDNQNLNKNLRALYREGLGHVQKVEVLRYNPYEDTGGNVSFSIALLDGRNYGVLLTSLHTRAGTRVYVKGVENGYSDVSLSKEESQVLEKAIGGKQVTISKEQVTRNKEQI